MQSEKDRSKYLYGPKTVKGNTYLYFRMVDGKLVPLPIDQKSIEFKRAYDACRKARNKTADQPAASAPPPERKPLARVAFIGGTVGAAIKVYRNSIEYDGLKPGTKKNYNRALNLMLDYLGQGLLGDVDTDAVDIYSEMIAKDHSASAAKLHIDLLSNVWRVCRKHAEFDIKQKINPTIDAAKRYTVKRPHKPWKDDHEDLFMATAPGYLKLAKLLLHFGAQRGGDSVKIKWSDFDGRGLYVQPEKTDGGADLEPKYHLCPKPLLDALNRAPRIADTILVNSLGKPWSNAMCLSHGIRGHLMKIGLVKKGQRSLTMHGLRKNAAADLATAGANARDITTVTGHKTEDMARFYAKDAENRAINEATVERWNAALAAKEAKRVGKRRAAIRRVK